MPGTEVAYDALGRKMNDENRNIQSEHICKIIQPPIKLIILDFKSLLWLIAS
jgi:hypothetical protein